MAVSTNICVTDCETRIYSYHSETVITVEISFTTSEKARQMRQLYCLLGHAVAQAVSHWLSTAAARVRPRSGHVGFVVDKLALGQVFSLYFFFLHQSSFHQIVHPHNHLVADMPSGPSWTPSPTIRIKKKED
jgi:hypothetical protein